MVHRIFPYTTLRRIHSPQPIQDRHISFQRLSALLATLDGVSYNGFVYISMTRGHARVFSPPSNTILRRALNLISPLQNLIVVYTI
ncbi:hypothetical protein A2U01_0009564, partial [Trifolium medium]|nr:hypothetical protein [Trifolium medium]